MDKKIGAYFSPLKVEATDTPSSSVKIRAGSFWNSDGFLVEYPGGKTQPIIPPTTMYQWSLISLSLTGLVIVTSGNPSSTPLIPPLPDSHIPLAAVLLSPNMTTITNDRIQDVRPSVVSQSASSNIQQQLNDRPSYGDLTSLLDLKPDRAVSVTPGNFVGFDIAGNLMDMGISPSDVAAAANVSVALQLKADKDSVVTLTGSQLIAGTKTFSDNIIVQTTHGMPVTVFSNSEASGIQVSRGSDPTTSIEWNNTSQSWQISNPDQTNCDIVTAVNNPVSGNLAAVTATGQLTDSGLSPQSLVRLVPVPKNNGSPGIFGQMAVDGKNIYFCVATNTWLKTALVPF